MISISFMDTFNSHYHGTFFDSLQKADFVMSLTFSEACFSELNENSETIFDKHDVKSKIIR